MHLGLCGAFSLLAIGGGVALLSSQLQDHPAFAVAMRALADELRRSRWRDKERALARLNRHFPPTSPRKRQLEEATEGEGAGGEAGAEGAEGGGEEAGADA